jgi:hypothetical protein
MAEHVFRIFGGFDYDVYVCCSCGEYIIEGTHDDLTIAELTALRASHMSEVDNG